MSIKDFFEAVGGDYETVISRLPSDELIKKFVRKFLDDPSFSNLKNAFGNGDVRAAFLAAHTLKGTSANLGLDALAKETSELTELLRNAENIVGEDYFTKVERVYKTTCENITLLD